MDIKSEILKLKNELPQDVKLVAVSKFKPSEDILEAYSAGQRAFGENRPQEMAAKAAELPKDIEWHFIGHLQTNKIKYVLPWASLIHSVDTIHLLEAIDRAAREDGKVAECLLEIHIAKEESKQGFSPEEAVELSEHFDKYPNVRFRGVMGMASHIDDMQAVRLEFRSLRALADRIGSYVEGFDQVSMGMSGDYKIAVEEGATIVRIGSTIFGARNYQL